MNKKDWSNNTPPFNFYAALYVTRTLHRFAPEHGSNRLIDENGFPEKTGGAAYQIIQLTSGKLKAQA